MEGVGSRLGRASSRYGGPAPVFSGPVRKWKKQWVHVSSSSSSSSTVSYHNTTSSTRSNNNGSSKSNHNNNNNTTSALLLCRWTPVPPTNTDEPPRRKFRYTPIVVLEEPKKEAGEKVDEQNETSRVHTLGTETCKSDDASEKPDSGIQATNKNPMTGQHSKRSRLNLDLGLEGLDENHDSDGN